MRTALFSCGQVALALKGKVAREDKAPDSPHQLSTGVSAVDRICQDILLLRALELAPDLEVQSEELADCPPRLRALFEQNENRFVLVLDPLDGTECFLRGGVEYAHMGGVLDQTTGQMVCAMVYFPETAHLYSAVRGEGVQVSEGFGAGKGMKRGAAPPRTYAEVKRLLPSDRTAFDAAGFKVDASRNHSAADDLLAVAEGRIGASVYRQFHGHDSAIVGLLIEELGGAVLGADGKAVRYEKAMPRMPLVICSLSQELAQELYRATERAP